MDINKSDCNFPPIVFYEEKIYDREDELLKTFKSKLRFLIILDENHPKLPKDLFQTAPKNLNLEEIINFIFTKCRTSNIPILLETMLCKDPSFVLSPQDQIRRAIAEKQVTTNSSLIAQLKENEIEDDEKKVAACYDLAYRMNCPDIYRLSQTPILPGDYSLNFLWVNLNPQDRVQDIAQNIFGEGTNLSENAECLKDPEALRAFEKTESQLGKKTLEEWEKSKKLSVIAYQFGLMLIQVCKSICGMIAHL